MNFSVSARGREGDEPHPGTDIPEGDVDEHARVIVNFYNAYNFHSAVDARGGTFGTACHGRCGAGDRLRYTTGALREAEVLATVSNYARPPRFDDAEALLRRDRVVVLEGPPGSGRRAGALALLRAVTDDRIVELSPTQTARSLAESEYLGRYGFLAVGEEQDSRDFGAELGWTGDAVRGSYLVVTTTAARGRTTSADLPHLPWERPSTAEVLRMHLAANWAKDDVDKLVELIVPRLPANCTLEWLAHLARLVNARRDPARAVQDLAEMSGRQVDRWFAQQRSYPELAEVTAAAFLTGISEHKFRSWLTRLERILANHKPVGRGRRSARGEASAGAARRPASGADDLLHIRYVASWAGATGVVDFKDRSYQRFVLTRIWRKSESWFLAAVLEWIRETVAEVAPLEIASGLAVLACTDFDAVKSSLLDPWSLGRLGRPGQVMAIYVLWCMCREESTAPLALRTAIQWTNSGYAIQRATAVTAFSGELGVSYPTDAARRLCQLTTQAGELRAASLTALGRLFAVLVDQTREAGAVLETLDARYLEVRSMRGVTVSAALAVLTARSHRTARPAVAELLHAEPDKLEVVARLWARVIRRRPSGPDGIAALREALLAYQQIGDDRTSTAEALGRALASTLSTAERVRLRMSLTRLDQQRRHGRGQPAAALVAFLDAAR